MTSQGQFLDKQTSQLSATSILVSPDEDEASTKPASAQDDPEAQHLSAAGTTTDASSKTLSKESFSTKEFTKDLTKKIIPESIRTAVATGIATATAPLRNPDNDTSSESWHETRRTSSPGPLPTAHEIIKPQGVADHGLKSSSKSVMSKHAFNLGFYTLNLGTDSGQKIYSLLMILLPMIPLLILICQLGTNLVYYQNAEKDLTILRQEVMDALDIANLVQQLQEERAAVALNNFLWNMDSSPSLESIEKITNLTKSDLDVDDLNKALNLSTRFAATDSALAGVNNWPTRLDIQSHNWPGEFFNSKLSFQIKHGVFRSNLKTGEKTIFEVLKWYDYINSFILDYIAYSIHVSSIGGFYWYIIALQDLLRATEYTGASGVYAIRYYVNGNLSVENHRNYIILDSLQEEYLHNTYNSMPNITQTLDAIIRDEDIQWDLYNNSRAEVTKNHYITPNTTMAVRQFEAMFMYTSALRKILVGMADNIKNLVDSETNQIKQKSKWPIVMLACLIVSVPIIIYLSSKASYSMRLNSKMFDEQAENLNRERRKTDGLLWQLLPAEIISKLKAGEQPPPKLYKSATVFFGDICGFTNLTALSTASQTIKFLNELYKMFDATVDSYDVYKVEIVGDGYLVASGLPHPNGDKHASEIATMALQLMFQVDSFKIAHRPNYKLRMRMGVHSGSCVGSVVGSKMPHFSVFGDTVNIAAIMESTSEPMKIQISHFTKKLLARKVGFSTQVRGQIVVPRIGEITTYWLLANAVSVDDVANSSRLGRVQSQGESTTGSATQQNTIVEQENNK